MTAHQLTLRLDTDQTATDPSTLYGAPCPHVRVSELDRLKDELATVERHKANLAVRQLELRGLRQKLTRRSEAISLQIDSLERNPLAILRYQSRLVPVDQQGTLWQYRPLSDLRLEAVLGTRTLELLVARCPTVGDLEIMRVHEGLSSMRRIGKSTAEKIETRLLDWLNDNAYGYRPPASYEHRQYRSVSTLPREIVL